MQPTPLANDVAAADVLRQVVSAQRPCYTQVCSMLNAKYLIFLLIVFN